MKRIILDKTEFIRLWDECVHEDTGKSRSRFSNDGLTMLAIDVDGSISTRKNTAFADSKLTYFFPIKMNAEISFSNAQKELDKYHGTFIYWLKDQYLKELHRVKNVPPLGDKPELPKDVSYEVYLQWQQDVKAWEEKADAMTELSYGLDEWERAFNRELGIAPEGTHITLDDLHFLRRNEQWFIFTDEEWKKRVEF